MEKEEEMKKEEELTDRRVGTSNDKGSKTMFKAVKLLLVILRLVASLFI